MDLRRTPALKNNELGTTDDTARVRISKLDAEVGEMREGATHRGGPIYEKRREGGATSPRQGIVLFHPHHHQWHRESSEKLKARGWTALLERYIEIGFKFTRSQRPDSQVCYINWLQMISGVFEL